MADLMNLILSTNVLRVKHSPYCQEMMSLNPKDATAIYGIGRGNGNEMKIGHGVWVRGMAYSLFPLSITVELVIAPDISNQVTLRDRCLTGGHVMSLQSEDHGSYSLQLQALHLWAWHHLHKWLQKQNVSVLKWHLSLWIENLQSELKRMVQIHTPKHIKELGGVS